MAVQRFTAHNGQLLNKDGSRLHVKGISWFGFETQDFVVNGLWQHTMEFYFDLIKDEGFNMIRLPFSADLILNNYHINPPSGLVSADASLRYMESMEIMDAFFDMAHERDIYIMLDLHRLNHDYISELWYSPTNHDFTEESFFNAWFRILDRYRDHPALWGVELLNEPHGSACWCCGDDSRDWKKFAQYALPKFRDRYENNTFIYIVMGVGWGKDLSQAVKCPIPDDDDVIYSAHNYGRSVVYNINVDDTNALHEDWDHFFGDVRLTNRTVMITETGGRTDLDSVWMTKFADYLVLRNMTDVMFWSLGPNSGDVKGYLLDDWTSVDVFKRQLMNSLSSTT